MLTPESDHGLSPELHEAPRQIENCLLVRVAVVQYELQGMLAPTAEGKEDAINGINSMMTAEESDENGNYPIACPTPGCTVACDFRIQTLSTSAWTNKECVLDAPQDVDYAVQRFGMGLGERGILRRVIDLRAE